MATRKVKSQTAVTVEVLGRLPQSDCDRMAEDLQADPPAKTVHVKSSREGSLSPLQASAQVDKLREHSVPFQVYPFLAPITWPACWSLWLRLFLRHPERW